MTVEKPDQKVVIAIFPKPLAKAMDQIAQIESRTRSDLVREAVRRYVHEAVKKERELQNDRLRDLIMRSEGNGKTVQAARQAHY